VIAPSAATAARGPVRAVRRTLVLALAARVPIGALSLLIILVVRESDRSYAQAGLASGACALGMTFSAPVMGRLMDRVGQTVVLLVAAAATAATFTAFAALPDDAPDWAFPAAALLCGLSLPPVSASVRVIWRRMLDTPAFNRVVTLDASLQELAFMLGPLTLVSAATRIGAAATLAVTGVAWAAVTAIFALLSETRAVGGSARPPLASPWGPVREHGVRTLLFVAIALGACIGASELGVVAVADDHDARGAIGLLYGAWCLGSLAGGLYAMRHPPRDLIARTQALLVFVAVATTALALAPGPVTLGVLLLVAGIANAPLFAAVYTVMADVARPETATEAYSLQAAGLTIGIAAGVAAAGAITSLSGSTGAFLAGAAAMLAGAVVFRRATGELRRAPRAAAAAG
jgi:MFS family permease